MRLISKLSNIIWFTLAIVLLWNFLSPQSFNNNTRQGGPMSSFFES